MTDLLKVAITGAAGRMGKMLIQDLARHEDCLLVGATVNDNDPARGMDAGEIAGIGRTGVILTHQARAAFEKADVVIDFTTPSASLEHCLLANMYNTTLVIGTTGFNDTQKQMLIDHGKRVPIVGSPNMSMGVNILIALSQYLSTILDERYDVEILEMHHRYKADAPSGTALALGAAAARGRGINIDEHSITSRDGQTGARPQGNIGFAALRGGDVIGDHHVIFAGDGERIEIAHKASNRHIYASGAIKAAKWVVGKEPKLYTMRDVLGLERLNLAK
jgi:4-hydroxy-tetrahydrodipicolinate reductase